MLVTTKKIAFYAPLKSADHPVPSGDRLMAQQLINCLTDSGYRVEIASRLRAFLRNPDTIADITELEKQAGLEIQRLTDCWSIEGAPAIWFCYHPYYKSPDLIGPALSGAFNIPYVTAEASYSNRRRKGLWGQTQEHVLTSLNRAAVNICFTERDREGIEEASELARLARVKPFIDPHDYMKPERSPETSHLVAVAMMRSGDKMDSYERLAGSLEHILHVPWTLSVVGDGNRRADVQQLFSGIPQNRITWHGQLERIDIAALFARCSLYVWPGCGEAYGLAYLEAQAAGLPVVAFETAGVPEVVVNGHTGTLTAAGDEGAFAMAIADLLHDLQKLNRFSGNARLHVQREHTAELASVTLKQILELYTRAHS